MDNITLKTIDNFARGSFPEDYELATGITGLDFASQVYVFHDEASGFKLRLSSIIDLDGANNSVWAVIIFFGSEVAYYRDSEALAPSALKYVQFEEPFRTLAGACKTSTSIRPLAAFVWYLFMENRILEFFKGNLNDFKYACKRIADAKR